MNCLAAVVCFTLLFGGINAALQPRIIGGETARIEHYPYQASIRHNSIHFCGATILDELHVLTAAQCIHNYKELFVPPYHTLSIVTGTSASRASAGNKHVIERVSMHPQYTGTDDGKLANDIAVITLKKKIKFDKYQHKIELPQQDITSGVKAMFTGWGYISEKRRQPALELQKLEMKVINNYECAKHIDAEIINTQLCAYNSPGHGSCNGDSGSPLVFNNEVIGVLSWIPQGDCAKGHPEVFTNVYAHRAFIGDSLKH